MSEGPALRVDGERVSPDRFYATACDPAKSVVVEACAGSGKTWNAGFWSKPGGAGCASSAPTASA